MDKTAIADAARAIIYPLKVADDNTDTGGNHYFMGSRTNAGRTLPPYYLVYFLLVDLLEFKNLGRFDKTAWMLPIDFKGRGFTIEHRKLELGIFTYGLENDEALAKEIRERIVSAVEVAEPYFEWRANQAANGSSLNVVNKAGELFDRHRYYADQYEAKRTEAEARKDEQIKIEHEKGFGIEFPSYQFKKEATWLALSTIETFFSWTEHVFIHIGILNGNLQTGVDVKKAANSNWFDKFDLALDKSNLVTARLLEELTVVRKQLRNFDAHGSFGKQREAFSFHSSVGAVPLRLPHMTDTDAIRFGHGVDFVDHDAIELLEHFIEHLWSGPRAPAKIYIQESSMPLNLTFATDGTYIKAMKSETAMHEFCMHQSYIHDQYANMDF